MSEYQVEEVRDVDAVWPELTGLMLELQAHHEPFGYPQLAPDWSRRWRIILGGPEEKLVLLVRSDGEAIGYFVARIIRHPGLYDQPTGYVDDAYVRPEARRRGIGADLLRRIEAWCLRKGIDRIRLSVAAANQTGIDFWQGNGFKPIALTLQKELTEVSP